MRGRSFFQFFACGLSWFDINKKNKNENSEVYILSFFSRASRVEGDVCLWS